MCSTSHNHAHARTQHTHAIKTKSSNFRSVGLHPSSPSLQSKESELEPLISQTDRVVFLQHPRFSVPVPSRLSRRQDPRCSPRTRSSASSRERLCQTRTTDDREFFCLCDVRLIHIPIRETISGVRAFYGGPNTSNSRFSCCSSDFPRVEKARTFFFSLSPLPGRTS
jgi:hypothetical protein